MAATKQIGGQVLQLADDYAAALDVLGQNVAANTAAATKKSLDGLLGQLRRSYGKFLDEGTPDSLNAKGEARRPMEYTIREATTRYTELLDISRDFLPDAEIKALQLLYQRDLAKAIELGGELQGRLISLVDPRRVTPFAGPDKRVLQAAGERASAFIRGETMAFRDGLTRITLDGVAQGRGYRSVVKDVRRLLEGAADPNGLNQRIGLNRRVELIARSELANAYVQAQMDYAQAGGYRYVRWIAVGDERTCLTCGSRSGSIFRVDEVSGTAHPLCRCVMAAVPNEAVEETDPERRAVLSDEAFWTDHRKQAGEALQKANNWDVSKLETRIRQSLSKPTATERRLYPDLKKSAQPVL
jgi:SPP1 gp7 family putative phage head morphogenesis protein